ncbi:MAG: septum formation inhibitor Maf [Gammaproteobacteria bacterium]|jgi:septum formation protein|nr:septum formation inhibitor Maf [Gammaproteobacteria bacterium]MBU1408501.1 septum formation inhibitor Maf [Gammaproteobacteria bacterium]MBU1532313.1 septum formation inhibitor Maf [Gammaproteobacteria bacterium]
MLVDKRIYLASQSPRRRELLKQIGIAFDVLPLRGVVGRIDVIEIPHAGEPAPDFAQRMAIEKAASGWRAVEMRRLLRFPVLGADTVVELEGTILGKPADREDAAAMLARLSGRLHQVHTAVAVQHEDRVEMRLSSSQVRMATLDAAAIARYLECGEYLGKAGAYAIQGRAGAFVEHIDGSYSGIMGLPLYDTAVLLRSFGLTV